MKTKNAILTVGIFLFCSLNVFGQISDSIKAHIDSSLEVLSSGNSTMEKKFFVKAWLTGKIQQQKIPS